MLTALIACIIGGLCTAAFISLWFWVSFRVLSDSYREVVAAIEQIRIHHAIYRQERGSMNAETAKRMLDTSRMIYLEALMEYNHFYTKPIYRLPGFLIGFRMGKEEEF